MIRGEGTRNHHIDNFVFVVYIVFLDRVVDRAEKDIIVISRNNRLLEFIVEFQEGSSNIASNVERVYRFNVIEAFAKLRGS